MHLFALVRCCPSMQMKGGGCVGHHQLPRQQGSNGGKSATTLMILRGEKQSWKYQEFLVPTWYPALGNPSSVTWVCKPGLISIALVQTQGLARFVLCCVPFFHIIRIFIFSILKNSLYLFMTWKLRGVPAEHQHSSLSFLLNLSCYKPKGFYSFGGEFNSKGTMCSLLSTL